MVRPLWLQVAACVAVGCLAGCGRPPGLPNPSSAPPAPTHTAPPPTYTPSVSPVAPGSTIPAFSGPYAKQFEDAYYTSTTGLQRRILADGQITQGEMRLLYDDYARCLNDYGFEGVVVRTDGSMMFHKPDGWTNQQVEDGVKLCRDARLGTTDLLYQDVKRNPDNINESQLMATCLVRVELAPSTYTADDYAREAPDHFSFDTRDPRFERCVFDPTHATK